MTLVTQAVATELMGIVYFNNVIRDLSNLVMAVREEIIDDVKALEEGALLLSKTLWTWQELLLEAPRNRICTTRKQLYELANKLQRRLDSLGGVEVIRCEEVVGLLNTMMIEEMGFEGNSEDFYSAKNFSIEHTFYIPAKAFH